MLFEKVDVVPDSAEALFSVDRIRDLILRDVLFEDERHLPTMIDVLVVTPSWHSNRHPTQPQFVRRRIPRIQDRGHRFMTPVGLRAPRVHLVRITWKPEIAFLRQAPLTEKKVKIKPEKIVINKLTLDLIFLFFKIINHPNVDTADLSKRNSGKTRNDRLTGEVVLVPFPPHESCLTRRLEPPWRAPLDSTRE